jgi:ribosome-binding factor A
MKTHRLARVAEVIREVASETVLFHLQDPRIKNVTVTRAEVSGDLQHAKVFVSIMGTDKEQDLCMHGLKRSAGYVQSKLGSRLKTRFTPSVRFVKDEGVKQSIEITRLIHEAMAQSRAEDQARAAESGMETGAGADEEPEEA